MVRRNTFLTSLHRHVESCLDVRWPELNDVISPRSGRIQEGMLSSCFCNGTIVRTTALCYASWFPLIAHSTRYTGARRASDAKPLITSHYILLSYTGFGPLLLGLHLCLWTHFKKWIKSRSPTSLQKENVRSILLLNHQGSSLWLEKAEKKKKVWLDQVVMGVWVGSLPYVGPLLNCSNEYL